MAYTSTEIKKVAYATFIDGVAKALVLVKNNGGHVAVPLGEGLDGVSFPSGGDTGDVLVKTSEDDGDVNWEQPSNIIDFSNAVFDEPGPAQNGITSTLLLLPPGGHSGVNALTIKVPDKVWGDNTQPYGHEQALVILNDSDALASDSAGQTISQDIVEVANETPVRVRTTAAHGCQTGDVMRITGTGIAALDNKWWKITVLDVDEITLNTSVASGASVVGHLYGNRSSVLARIDAFGGIGGAGGMHVAPGLRGRSGAGFIVGGVGGAWFEPHIDTISIVLDNPPATAWKPAPTAPYLRVRDRRSDPVYTLLDVDAAGILRINKGIYAQGRVVADVPLTIKQIVGGTGVLTDWRRANDSRAMAIGQSGNLVFYADDGTTNAGWIGAGDTGIIGFRAYFSSVNPATVPLLADGVANQTGDLIQVGIATAIQSRFNKAGYFMSRKTAAPALGDMVNGEFALWVDIATLALKVTIKNAGALTTRTLAA